MDCSTAFVPSGLAGHSFIAASATIADPKQHQAIWGTLSADVVAIEPHQRNGPIRHGVGEPHPCPPSTGCRKVGQSTTRPTLLGITFSTVMASTMTSIEGTGKPSKRRTKMICFADSKQFVTQWQTMLNENEGSMAAMASRQHFGRTGGAVDLPLRALA